MGSRRKGLSKTGVLGAFEEMVLLALVRQGDNAYPVSIRRELAERTGSDVAMGAVYATLDRLEAKGMVRPREEARQQPRPGRPRRYYDILPDGVRALATTRQVRDTMWQGVRLEAPGGAEGT